MEAEGDWGSHIEIVCTLVVKQKMRLVTWILTQDGLVGERRRLKLI